MGYSLSTDKYFTKELKEHFIIEDIEDVHKIDFGENIKNVYGLTSATEVLEFSNPKVSAGGVEEGIVLPANAEGKEFGEIHLGCEPLRKRSWGLYRRTSIHTRKYKIINACVVLRSE